MDDTLADFYIRLPSNTNMDYFRNNTQSPYRTKLSSPLILRGEWEVALCEFCFPRSWFNIGEPNDAYRMSMNREEKTIQEKIEHNVSFERKSPPYSINIGKGVVMEIKEFRSNYYVELSKIGEGEKEVRNRFNMPLIQLDILRKGCEAMLSYVKDCS